MRPLQKIEKHAVFKKILFWSALDYKALYAARDMHYAGKNTWHQPILDSIYRFIYFNSVYFCIEKLFVHAQMPQKKLNFKNSNN